MKSHPLNKKFLRHNALIIDKADIHIALYLNKEGLKEQNFLKFLQKRLLDAFRILHCVRKYSLSTPFSQQQLTITQARSIREKIINASNTKLHFHYCNFTCTSRYLSWVYLVPKVKTLFSYQILCSKVSNTHFRHAKSDL